MKKAVLFDMNGILVDDESLQERAFRQILEPMGYTFTSDEYGHFFVGKTDVAGLGKFFSSRGRRDFDFLEIAQRKRRVYEAITDSEGVKTYKGVKDTLEYLKARQIPSAVVTSESLGVASKTLSRLGFSEYFEAVITSDDIHESKPSPEGYLLGASRLGYPADECIVVEDAPSGVAAGIACGAFVVAITNTHPREMLAEANVVIDKITPEYVETLL